MSNLFAYKIHVYVTIVGTSATFTCYEWKNFLPFVFALLREGSFQNSFLKQRNLVVAMETRPMLTKFFSKSKTKVVLLVESICRCFDKYLPKI